MVNSIVYKGTNAQEKTLKSRKHENMTMELQTPHNDSAPSFKNTQDDLVQLNGKENNFKSRKRSLTFFIDTKWNVVDGLQFKTRTSQHLQLHGRQG